MHAFVLRRMAQKRPIGATHPTVSLWRREENGDLCVIDHRDGERKEYWYGANDSDNAMWAFGAFADGSDR